MDRALARIPHGIERRSLVAVSRLRCPFTGRLTSLKPVVLEEIGQQGKPNGHRRTAEVHSRVAEKLIQGGTLALDGAMWQLVRG